MPLTFAGRRHPFAVAALFLSLTACGGGSAAFGEERESASTRPITWGADAFRRYRVEKMQTPAAAPKVSTWETPAGWKELPSAQFKDVYLLVAGDEAAECYLTLGTGGTVQMNLDRWYGQMAQPKPDAAAVAGLPRRSFLGVQAYHVEIEGSFRGADGSLMVGLMAEIGGRLATLKMVGPRELLRREMAGFLALADSMRLDTGPGGAGGTEPAPTSTFKWEAPEQWKKTAPRMMRDVNFEVGEQTECYVTVLSGTGGGIKANVRTWCAQMGRPPLTEEEMASMPAVDILGVSSPLLRVDGSYTGKGGERIEDAALLVAVCMLPQQSVFVKMVGKASVVDENRQAFLDFCASLEK